MNIKAIVIASLVLAGCDKADAPIDLTAPQYLWNGRAKIVYVIDENNPRVCFAYVKSEGQSGIAINIGASYIPCNALNEMPNVRIKSTMEQAR